MRQEQSPGFFYRPLAANMILPELPRVASLQANWRRWNPITLLQSRSRCCGLFVGQPGLACRHHRQRFPRGGRFIRVAGRAKPLTTITVAGTIRSFPVEWAIMRSIMTRTDAGDAPSVERLLDQACCGEAEPLGQLLQLYRNYLTILATTQMDRRLRQRMSPSDLVQETMLAAHCDFKKFRGSSECELLAWLRRILVNSLYHAIETHLKAKLRDVRRDVSVEQASAALDQSVPHFAQVLADRGSSPSAPLRRREPRSRWPINSPSFGHSTAT